MSTAMTRRLRANLVDDAGAELGEGPHWHAETGTLLWVDIARGLVHHFEVGTGATSLLAVGSEVGIVVPRDGGGLIVALPDGIAAVNDDGRPERLCAIEEDLQRNRLNDGACDDAGRLWVGSIDREFRPGAGSLYRVDPDLSVTPMLRDVTISNGIGWSPDGERMYYVDSATRRVDLFDYDVRSGQIAERRPFVAIPPADGSPDGLAVGADGSVWVALWGGGTVHRYSADATLIEIVDVPATLVTSCAFGGTDRPELFVTSAQEGLSASDLAAQPAAGGLFRVAVDVSGRSVPGFAG